MTIATDEKEILDRNRAEEALRLSERRLAETQKLAHIGTWEWDLISDEAIGSAEMLRLLGLQPLGAENRFTIQSFIECLQPGDRGWVQQALRKAVEERGSIDYENRIVHPDGTVRIIHGLGEVVLDEAGEPVRMIGTAQDITERKKAEEAIQELSSNTALQTHIANTVLSTIGDMAYIFDIEGRFIYANQALLDLLCLRLDEVVGKNFFQLPYPEDLAANLQQQIQQVFDTQRDLVSETAFTSPTGVEGYYEYFFRPVFAADGTVFQVVGSTRDVTERKREEQALSASEARYRAVVDHFPNGAVFLFDQELRYVVAGGTSLAGAGLSPELVVGKTLWDLFAPEVAARDELALRAALRGETTRVETSYGERTYMVHTLPVTDSQDRIVGGLLMTQEITEQKLVEEARIGREAAEQANRAKSEYLSRMSHELRTPLNAILGFGQLLQLDDRTPEQEESIEHIVKAGRHLLGLINGVLDIARIEEGTLSLSIEPILIHDLLQETLLLMQPLAAHRKIQLSALPARTENCYVRADRQRLQQILLNLLANAIKYNREGGLVKVAYSEPGYGQDPQPLQLGHSPEKVRITVSDTGPGISPEKVGKLFTPFERAGAEQSDVEGTGLGLAISKSLVEAMGGSIGVESEEGAGCTFWVELASADEKVAQAEHNGSATGSLMGDQDEGFDRSILCIEDNFSNIRLIERILAKRPQTRLLTAMQGQVGLDFALKHQPDLILLDVHLPDMMGDEVLRQLRAEPRTASIPVIVLSADASPRQTDELLAAGAKAYLTKPINVKHLLKVIDEILARTTVQASYSAGV